LYAKLADLEIPARLIKSVIGSGDRAVHIKGRAVREDDRILLSKELGRLKVGDVVTFEATDSFSGKVNGTREISSIGFDQVIQNFQTILDFHISLKPK
jgi:hypothetical protein